jgi:2-C-methyl-D-erythritol 4-phosphate cytidylyltransferase
VVTGGGTRAESVRAGLAEVPDDALAVLVHDGARPLIEDDVIERVLIPLAEGFDGVVPALPLADTVKRIEDATVIGTVDRTGLAVAQTPQAFAATVLRTALDGDLEGATDCSSLVERCGGRVRVVEGDVRLLKVTTASDLALVEQLLAGA